MHKLPRFASKQTAVFTFNLSIIWVLFVVFVIPKQDKRSAHVRSTEQTNSMALNKQKPNTPEYINSSNYQLNNQPTYKLSNLLIQKLIYL